MQVQTLIGAKNATAFDLTAACSGFVVGLISAASYIRTGLYRNIIVIGADALSRYTDWRDRCKPIKFCFGVVAAPATVLQFCTKVCLQQPGWCLLLTLCSDCHSLENCNAYKATSAAVDALSIVFRLSAWSPVFAGATRCQCLPAVFKDEYDRTVHLQQHVYCLETAPEQ